MTPAALIGRARACWTGLAGVPVQFPRSTGLAVVVSTGSLLCPPGWAGIVAIGGTAIATVPRPDLATVLAGLDPAAVADVARIRALRPGAEVLGPATLAYLAADDLRSCGHAGLHRLVAGHPDVAALAAAVDPGEAAEAGVDDVTSDVFAVREGARLTAAAGYRTWPGAVAHLSVLTAADRRGRGLARATASAAAGDALSKGLLPQWRARLAASRRVAGALGFQQLGAQVSVRLAA